MGLEAGVGEVVILVEGELLERRVAHEHASSTRAIPEVQTSRIEFLEAREAAGNVLEAPVKGPGILIVCSLAIRHPSEELRCASPPARCGGPAIAWSVEGEARIRSRDDDGTVPAGRREVADVERVSVVIEVGASTDIAQTIILAQAVLPSEFDIPEDVRGIAVRRKARAPVGNIRTRRVILGFDAIAATIDKIVCIGITRAKPSHHRGRSKLATGDDCLDLGCIDDALPRMVIGITGHGLLAIDATQVERVRLGIVGPPGIGIADRSDRPCPASI